MCTAMSLCVGDHYFGRNLDLDHHYNEEITITPRNYRFSFRFVDQPTQHYAMIGIATIIDDYPLYYESVNEHGLCMAGLNFPGNAVYHPNDQTKTNIASFELIPWILSQCKNVYQAEEKLRTVNICNTAFRDDLPPTPLHWIISDNQRTITVEPMDCGLIITDNPVRVLTNNPPIYYHLHNLSNYMNLTPKISVNHFSEKLDLTPYSLGMGAIGLPGDASSASRFVRCAFLKENALLGDTEEERIHQIFHILDSVSQINGCVQTPLGLEKTIYSVCCNATTGVFYYTTCDNRQICAVDMHKENLNANKPIAFPLVIKPVINRQN